jgi:hypothetical protein
MRADDSNAQTGDREAQQVTAIEPFAIHHRSHRSGEEGLHLDQCGSETRWIWPPKA